MSYIYTTNTKKQTRARAILERSYKDLLPDNNNLQLLNNHNCGYITTKFYFSFLFV